MFGVRRQQEEGCVAGGTVNRICHMQMILPFYLNPGDLKPFHAESNLPCHNYSDTLIHGNSV
jgi:hypothetical protein